MSLNNVFSIAQCLLTKHALYLYAECSLWLYGWSLTLPVLCFLGRCLTFCFWCDAFLSSLSFPVFLSRPLLCPFLPGAPCAESLRWWVKRTAENMTSSPTSSTMPSNDRQPAHYASKWHDKDWTHLLDTLKEGQMFIYWYWRYMSAVRRWTWLK